MKNQNPIRLEKLRKYQDLIDQGINPYPHTWKKASWKAEKPHKSKDLTKRFEGGSFSSDQPMKKAPVGKAELAFQDQSGPKPNKSKDLIKPFYLAGRLMRKRPMGKAAFFTLQDQSGQFQCYIRRDSFIDASQSETKPDSDFTSYNENPRQLKPKSLDEELTAWGLWKLCDIGDIFSVKGSLFRTKKGEPSLKVQDLKILCKSLEPLPEKYHGLEDIELRYRFRHLDLVMNQESRKVFETRSKIIQEIRNFMNKEEFIEVETPVLQPIYGGAVAEPFETYFRRLGNQKMYLKISPEIYLKKLIVGGFEKVYEIGKNFRNEGIDRTHNPEFTMMEYYQAYTDYKYQMKLFKKLVNHVVKKIKGSLVFEYQGKELNFKKWETLTLKDAIKKHSQSEPDLYASFQKMIECIESTNQPNLYNRKQAQEMKKRIGSEHHLKQTYHLSEKAFALDTDKLSFEELFYLMKIHFPKENYSFCERRLAMQNALSQEERRELKEELTVMAFELIVEKRLWNPTFITDFPLSVSPLTKTHRSFKRSKRRLVERFEPYIACMELGNAYTELNDPAEQKKRLEKQERWSQKECFEKDFKKELNKELDKKKTEEGSQNIDKNFIHALEVGMPPTGGVGLGIERLVMILTDQKSVRDCILFPAQKAF